MYHKKIEIDFKQDINNSGVLIPPLLFIILLENAFKHGVESLVDNAFIHLQIKEDEDSILFTIKNNFDSEELPRSSGIGLVNLKERLNLLYPKTHNLTHKIEGNTYLATLELHKK